MHSAMPRVRAAVRLRTGMNIPPWFEKVKLMTRWAGRLIVFYGAAHLMGALISEGAIHYVGAWLSGDLWYDDLANMSAANSALWLSIDSFSVPLILVGATVIWMDRRDITPPRFIAWTLIVWTMIDAVILLFTPWPMLLVAGVLLLRDEQKLRPQR